MTVDTQIREHLQALLTSEHAHMTFEQAVADFPPESNSGSFSLLFDIFIVHYSPAF